MVSLSSKTYRNLECLPTRIELVKVNIFEYVLRCEINEPGFALITKVMLTAFVTYGSKQVNSLSSETKLFCVESRIRKIHEKNVNCAFAVSLTTANNNKKARVNFERRISIACRFFVCVCQAIFLPQAIKKSRLFSSNMSFAPTGHPSCFETSNL